MRERELRKPSDFRSIEGLAHVQANGRILNLGAIGREQSLKIVDRGCEREGLFANTSLNTAIIVKHNVRENERYLFSDLRPVATKVILPIDPNDLGRGGIAFMLGERHAGQILEQRLGLTKSKTTPAAERDLQVLDILDELATLDPFIVRERFAAEGIELPRTFAAFRVAGDAAMLNYFRAQLQPLVAMALPNGASSAKGLNRLIDEMFDHAGTSDRVDALRSALGISTQDWPGALFAWKAALFYEYRMRGAGERFRRFMCHLRGAPVYGYSALAPADGVMRLRLELIGRTLRVEAQLQHRLNGFAEAFREKLLGGGSPQAFRDYVIGLSDHLYDFGSLYGLLEQMVGYWEYWFLSRGLTSIPAELFMDVARDLLAVVDPTGFSAPLGMIPAKPERVLAADPKPQQMSQPASPDSVLV